MHNTPLTLPVTTVLALPTKQRSTLWATSKGKTIDGTRPHGLHTHNLICTHMQLIPPNRLQAVQVHAVHAFQPKPVLSLNGNIAIEHYHQLSLQIVVVVTPAGAMAVGTSTGLALP